MSGGEARLPPGQALTAKFPVVGEGRPSAAALDLAAWRLEVGGLVAKPLSLTYGEILEFRQERVADIHCVTGWTHLAMRLEGWPLSRLLEAAAPLPAARFVRFEAYSERRHDTSLPLALAVADTWLVHSRDGRPLEQEHGFPLRTVTPSRYFYKSLKWVHRIELLAEDRLGYWERESSYHNGADPWAGDQRFTSGSLAPERLRALREALDLAPWRGPRKTQIGLDLRRWRPRTRDLRALHLKSCDLREASFAGCDLRAANLSLSDLRGADLAGADLRGADLEGCDLSGAGLEEADLRGAALTATRFVAPEGASARVAGVRWTEGGLLESQEAFLRAAAGEPEAAAAD